MQSSKAATEIRFAIPFIIAASLSLSVHAQTSVSVYGNLDIGFNKESGKASTIGRGYNNWLGFKGSEDLGNGLAAIFHLQTRFMPDTGEQERPSTFWQGESTVGLTSKDYGSLRLGRALTPMWAGVWAFEPWANSGFNGSLAAYQTGSYSSDGVNDAMLGFANASRVGNAVFYDSPDIAGLRVSIAGQVERAQAARTRNVGVAVNGGKGPVKGMIAYERNQNSDDIVFVGASLGFGDLTLMASWAHTEAAGLPSERVAVLAGTYALGADAIRAGYGRHLVNDNHKLSVGYVHRLSPRTSLYADLYRESTTASTSGYAMGISHVF